MCKTILTHRYGYVLNNPLLYTGPSEEVISALIGISVGVVINGMMNSINKVPFSYGAGKALP
ncbi:hypothetical protein [Myroides odoratimimus]|uniref:hypothetical protein n=1 Tax=Myroides odoratimimus TaxID=76832 RepID=UPI002577E79A|nr:hypothetical protein [Myroides odoratimimus]MDM1514752.1 hypothetical protein [Myroides odoratimimus]MDM1537912.1 hypothetical protein [Myroides odoratimimus]MDM1677485.1 hypothetical protein [Myroides odoratimimus]